ncbi:MAG: fibronectin type III domain-containing protein [Planctomycetota bacterium]|jgi:hypothetical protein
MQGIINRVRARRTHALAVLLVGTIALLSAAGVPTGSAGAALEFDDATMIIETNATDGDAGIQVFLDGDPWRRVRIKDPNGRRVLEISGQGELKGFGLTELFSESNEPSFGEMPFAELLEMFPEGEYRFVGRTTEGHKLVTKATFSHDVPDGPDILSPAEDEVVDPNSTVITWDGDVGPAGIVITGFQVVVEREDPLRVFSVTLPATATSVTVPAEFMEPATEYKVEVLAIAVNGNQTITEVPFETE